MNNLRWCLLPILCGMISVDLPPAWSQQQKPAEEQNEAFRRGESAVAMRKINTSTPEEAAIYVEELLATDPGNLNVQMLRMSVASRSVAGGKNDIAAEQIEKLVAYLFANTDRPDVLRRMSSAASMISSLYSRMGENEKGEQILNRTTETIEASLAKTPDPTLLPALVQLTSLRAQRSALSGDPEAAIAMIHSRRDELQKFVQEPLTADAASLGLARLMQAEITIVSRTQPELVDQLVQQQKEFLIEALQQNPLSGNLLFEVANSRTAQISQIVRDDPENAERQLKESLEFFESPEFAENAQLKSAIARLKQLERSIASAMILKRLIGQPAPPFEIASWAHGGPSEFVNFKGKVVLLDFWAVWCGPCIATFPHLKELHHEFHDQGFEIVGVTRQYNYQWNSETSRAAKAPEEVSLDEELAMLNQFMSHHELPHATIVTPKDSQMHSAYGVTGIPHAVLIDRSGNVRMIKVGSGPANAKALYDMVRQLVAE